VTKRTRKDSYENALVLLHLVRHSQCTVRRSECAVIWDSHALLLNAHQLC